MFAGKYEHIFIQIVTFLFIYVKCIYASCSFLTIFFFILENFCICRIYGHSHCSVFPYFQPSHMGPSPYLITRFIFSFGLLYFQGGYLFYCLTIRFILHTNNPSFLFLESSCSSPSPPLLYSFLREVEASYGESTNCVKSHW